MTNLKTMTLGKRIAHMRRAQGLTQEALAERLNISAQAVSKWENDLNCPDIMTLPKLAELLGVTTDTLLTGAPSPLTPEGRMAKKPEELVVCIQIVSEDGTAFRCNLPFRAFRICARYSMLSITFNSGEGDANVLSRLDCDEVIRMIESGVTGKLMEHTVDGERITIWTE